MRENHNRNTFLGVALAAAMALGVSPVRAGEPAPTNAEVARRAALELTEAFDEGLPELQGAATRVSLRPMLSSKFDSYFEDLLAPRLLDRGYDVWILEPEEQAAEGSLLLQYQVLQASVRYPKQSHGFLGLGTPKIRRRVDLQVKARIDEPDGRLLWSETPEAHYRDSFPAGERMLVEKGQPEWIATPLTIEKGAQSSAGFLEKITILGLIGGVVALYVSGAG